MIERFRMYAAYEGKIAALQRLGLFIGERDPRRNTAFKGAFMVAEPISDQSLLPTESAMHGGYCIVGDTWRDLVDTAYSHFEGG